MSEDGTGIWDAIDYGRDAIIEASAGTGKTYTLEHIVLKMVQDGLVADATQILLVTYTEKAAGELRDRVRGALERAGKLPPDFDAMTIGTIHSFCKQLLTEYAFENGMPMRLQVTTADKSLKRQAVLDALHSEEFSRRYRDLFPVAMFTADIESLDGISGLIAKALHQLSAADNASGANATATGLSAAAASWGMVVTAKGGQSFADWLSNNGQAPKFLGIDKKLHSTDADKAKAAWDAVAAAMDACASPDAKTVLGKCLTRISDPKAVNPRFGSKRLLDFDAGGNPDLQAVQTVLNTFIAVYKGLGEGMVAVLTRLARAALEQQKQDAGLLTFDDMVARAGEAVIRESQKTASPLLAKLRERYRYALVDEFQDTDAKQWDIFRTVFSHTRRTPDTPGALLVVGDPKQAIYSFRGADIATYLLAKREITAAGVPPYRLDKTFRCTRQLVDAFNTMFGKDDGGAWFTGMRVTLPGGGEEAIDYPESQWGEAHRADAAFAPVVLLESLRAGENGGGKGLGNATRCVPVFARNAARAIRGLRGTAIPGANTGPLDYGDFCILVRGKSRIPAIKRALAREGIPYAHYKESGLYSSAEAESVLAMLDFLAKPQGKGNLQAALLTPFFGVPPAELESTAAKLGQPFWDKVNLWQELAEKRDWSGLFAALLLGTDLNRRRPGDFEFDRRHAGVRQIFDDLLTRPGHPALALADFCDRIRQWKAEEGDDTEAGLRQKESDAAHVQIMTMHSSKGLQFPVVFIADGFSKTDDATLDEEKRIYYVALTRAQYRLYLPWSARTPADEPPSAGIGSAGAPLRGGFLAAAINRLTDAGLVNRGDVFDFPPPAAPATPAANPPSGPESAWAPVAAATPTSESPAAPFDGIFRYNSYSSLSRFAPVVPDSQESDANGSELPAESPALLDGRPDADPDEDPAPDGAATIDDSLLPHGTVTGDIFHEIMETLCNRPDDDPDSPGFGNATAANLMATVAGIRTRHGLRNRENADRSDSTDQTLARMAEKVLNTQIKCGGEEFRLRDIPPADRRAETRFVISEEELLGTAPRPGGDGVFNGSVDLLFRVNGKYFILDWKTTTLRDADGNPDYGKASLKHAWQEKYALQAQMYTAAVNRWLGRETAGVIYFFVRGVEGGKNPTNGVYAQEPDPEWLAALPGAIQNALAGHTAMLREIWRGRAEKRREQQTPPAALTQEDR